MNRLVPYLDLFARLNDAELARLGRVDVEVACALRKQVRAIDDGLAPYRDLLARLEDDELSRLTGASVKTIRFWRLCQPREAQAVGVSRDEVGHARPAADASADPAPAEGPEPSTTDLKSVPPGQPPAVQPGLQPSEPAPPPKPTEPAEPAGTVVPQRPAREPTPVDPLERQKEASQFMTFAGEPFPGFDDSDDNPFMPPREPDDGSNA